MVGVATVGAGKAYEYGVARTGLAFYQATNAVLNGIARSSNLVYSNPVKFNNIVQTSYECASPWLNGYGDYSPPVTPLGQVSMGVLAGYELFGDDLKNEVRTRWKKTKKK